MLFLMFCPHCGTKNAEDTKFCRGCGEDLQLVSQAVAKSLPLVIANKVDNVIERRKEEWYQLGAFRKSHRKAISELVFGLASLFLIVWTFLLKRGDPDFAYGFLTVAAMVLLVTGIYDLWQGTRRNRQADTERLHSAMDTNELPPAEPGRLASPASVTESTTRKLTAEPRRSEAEDKRQ